MPDAQTQFYPLYDVDSAQPIAGFPRTVTELRALDGTNCPVAFLGE